MFAPLPPPPNFTQIPHTLDASHIVPVPNTPFNDRRKPDIRNKRIGSRGPKRSFSPRPNIRKSKKTVRKSKKQRK